MKGKVLGAEQFTELRGQGVWPGSQLDVEVMLSAMTNCTGEFNTEPDELKYQIAISVLQIIKIEFRDRKRKDSSFRLGGQGRTPRGGDIYDHI